MNTAAEYDVLVVDDSSVSREVMARALRQAGFTVCALDSPLGVTRTILRTRVRVVVLDWDMPSIPGDRVAELIRSNERLGRVNIVLVSADVDRPKPDAVDIVVPKTPGADAVTRVVRRLVRHRRERASREAMRAIERPPSEDK